MDITLLKFIILWAVCETIGLATGIPLKDAGNINANTRVKRSPANNFSLFGFNLGPPLSRAKESLNSIGNIFASPAVSSQSGYIDGDRQPIQTQAAINSMKYINSRPINTLTPIEDPYKSAITMAQHENLKKVDNIIAQQNDKNKVDTKPVSEKYQLFNDNYNSEPKRNDDSLQKYAGNKNYEKLIDKQLIDYIFQMTPDTIDDIDDITTTVDTTIEDTTGTGDFETTTTDELLRIPSAVVASLLG